MLSYWLWWSLNYTKIHLNNSLLECKQIYSKIGGLFILQNIAMEKEHNTKLFQKNLWQTCGHIYYFNTCKLNKSTHDSKRCTLQVINSSNIKRVSSHGDHPGVLLACQDKK